MNVGAAQKKIIPKKCFYTSEAEKITVLNFHLVRHIARELERERRGGGLAQQSMMEVKLNFKPRKHEFTSSKFVCCLLIVPGRLGTFFFVELSCFLMRRDNCECKL